MNLSHKKIVTHNKVEKFLGYFQSFSEAHLTYATSYCVSGH